MSNDFSTGIDPIALHPQIWQAFRRIAANESFFHAYFLTGWAGVGKRLVAQKLAQTILCSEKSDFVACGGCTSCTAFAHRAHPDFLPLISNEGKNTVFLSSVRSWLQQMRLRPVFSQYKIGFIENIGRLRLEAQNALLKTIEEPPPSTIIIMVHHSGDPVPATIISRCQVFRFPLLASHKSAQSSLGQTSGFTAEEKSFFFRFAQGRPFVLAGYDDHDLGKIFRSVRSLMTASVRSDRFLQLRQLIDSKKTADDRLLTLAISMLLFAFRDMLRNYLKNRGHGTSPAVLAARIEALASLRADLLAGKKFQPQLALENIIFDPIV